jgi:hypothetical protein
MHRDAEWTHTVAKSFTPQRIEGLTRNRAVREECDQQAKSEHREEISAQRP